MAHRRGDIGGSCPLAKRVPLIENQGDETGWPAKCVKERDAAASCTATQHAQPAKAGGVQARQRARRSDPVLVAREDALVPQAQMPKIISVR